MTTGRLKIWNELEDEWEVVGPASGGSQVVYQTKTVLETADILALFDTPIQIAPSPGSGKAIIPLHIVSWIDILVAFDLHGFDIAADWEAEITTETVRCTHNGSGLETATFPIGPTLVFWDQGNITGLGGKNSNAGVAIEDQAFFIYALEQNPSDGDGTMQVHFTYWIVDVS